MITVLGHPANRTTPPPAPDGGGGVAASQPPLPFREIGPFARSVEFRVEIGSPVRRAGPVG